MSINRIQKLLFSEYCDFEDMVLVESPFAETTRDGTGLRQVHLGLTPSKLVLATDYLPMANDSAVKYIPGVDPEIETFELIAVYPIECVNLSVFHRRKRQSLKARFCNNKILYFELGGFEKRKMFWNLWCEKVKYLNPVDPSSSHSETSVATSTTNSTLYLISSKQVVNESAIQLWCRYASSGCIGLSPPKWTDKHLYLGKEMEESPVAYKPGRMYPTIEEFVTPKTKPKATTIPTPLRSKPRDHIKEFDQSYSRLSFSSRVRRPTLMSRYSLSALHLGKPSLCLFHQDHRRSSIISMPSVIHLDMEEEDNQSLVDPRKSVNAFETQAELEEEAVRIWELSRRTPSLLSSRDKKHRRRFAFAPQPHFYHGLGPWNVSSGERYSLQVKRAVSVITVKRQPIEPELRLSVSKRHLVASISHQTLIQKDEVINRYKNINIIRMPPKRPMVFFWTPEYWYRPQSARDAYTEVQRHLHKIRLYQQSLPPSVKKKAHFMTIRKTKQSILTTDSDTSITSQGILRKKMKDRDTLVARFSVDRDFGDDKSKETPLQFLKKILKMELALTAWDFDSNTLAFQMTLIDKELFMRITPSELGVLVWQQSSKNAPNIGALMAFSHRISCLVVTEILKDDSEKIRARLVSRFINTAEKCNNISNFQSCRSVLCGLQSPPIYRLYSMWSYIRKRHSSKYETFEKLCRLYRDPRLCTYQKINLTASKNSPYLPFIGDLIGKLLDKIPDYEYSINQQLGIKVAVKQKKTILTGDDKKDDIASLLKKMLSSIKMWQPEIVEKGDDPIERPNRKVSFYSLSDYYRPLDFYYDNRQECLEECIGLLETYQKAAAHYIYNRNDLAREYLLKTRYREDKENFVYSFNIEPRSTGT